MPGSCRDDNALYLASAAFNMVSDIAMLSVPIYLIWNLQMSVQRKMGISAIFGTGALYVRIPISFACPNYAAYLEKTGLLDAPPNGEWAHSADSTDLLTFSVHERLNTSFDI